MSSPTQPTVLVVDDEADLRQLIAESLSADGFEVAQSPDAADAVERLKTFAYDALVVDLRLPDADGMEVLDAALARYPDILAVMVTGFGGVTEAVSAMKRGAADFLIKPFQIAQLSRVLKTGMEQRRLRQENAELRAQLRDRYRFDSIVGQSGTMQQMFQTLELVAPMNSTVLIHGETGTGKELIARTIHHNSPRADQRFVAFNSAAIPEPLAEAELFGHAKGAFTGAVAARVGRFELAHRGTLFIDEVGLMSLALQSKLLRALQEREIERVGESRPIKFDARVVAATNSDLRKLVKEGTFREDLYYRLNVIPITLPPLRDRREDIPLLARHFVQKSCRSNAPAAEVADPGRRPRADELLVARQHPSARERGRALGRDDRPGEGNSGPRAAGGHPAAGLVAAAADGRHPGRRHQLHLGGVAARARADRPLPREDGRQQAAGGSPAPAQPHDADRQAAPPEPRRRDSAAS